MMPTTEKNVGERLFFRYLLIYLSVFVPFLLSVSRGLPLPAPVCAGQFQLILLSLSLLGGVMTVSGVYLPLLCAAKAAADAATFSRITAMVRTEAIGFLQWNVWFLLSALSAFLFFAAAATACRFSYSHRERDFRLIFSKPFGRYLLQGLIFLSLAVLLAFLFSRAGELLPR